MLSKLKFWTQIRLVVIVWGMHTSMVKMMRTVHQLNMSWTVAAEKARWNSSLLPICVIATKVLVTEVPILAPISMGMAIWMSMPAPMAATMMEVKVEELWTRTVPKMPIINPITGLVSHPPLNMSPEIKLKYLSFLNKTDIFFVEKVIYLWLDPLATWRLLRGCQDCKWSSKDKIRLPKLWGYWWYTWELDYYSPFWSVVQLF